MTNIDADILVMNNKLEMVNKVKSLSLLNYSMKVYFSMNIKKISYYIFDQYNNLWIIFLQKER